MWPPRLSVRASAALATHSLTSSMLRMSIARCQPGLRGAPGRDVAIAALNSSILSSACWISALVRDDADEVVHRLLEVSLQRVWVLRLRAALRSLGGGGREFGGGVDRRVGRRRPTGWQVPSRNRRRRVRPDDRTPAGPRELPPRRFEPVHAAGAFTRGEQPGVAAAPVSGSTSMPPMTVAGADLHLVLGDVDFGQLHELGGTSTAGAS